MTVIPEWTLGDRLRRARETAGIGSEQMADIMLRDRNTITNYERGHTRPPRRVLARWAEVTDVPLEWLAGGPKFAWITADDVTAVAA